MSGKSPLRRRPLRSATALGLVLSISACGAPRDARVDVATVTTDDTPVKHDLLTHVVPQGSSIPHGSSTRFDAAADGFQFANDFKNLFGPFQTAGLCGGMVYTALDYYYAGKTIPQQSYRPETNSPLQSYIYGREETSISTSAGTWASWAAGGNGLPDTFATQIPAVISAIDQGRPIPLGLEGVNGTGNHQMLAVGYWTNPGALTTVQTEIYLYDPNHPGERMTLVFDPTHQVFTLAEEQNPPLQHQWSEFYADTAYTPQTPPVVPEPVYPDDGLVHELFVAVATGTNALMDGPNADLDVVLTDGTDLSFQNMNLGEKWLAGYTETVRLALPTPIDPHRIGSVVLTKSHPCDVTFPWNVSSIKVQAVGSSTWMLATGAADLSCQSPSTTMAVLQAPPSITYVTPPTALPGTPIVITGTGFRTDGTTSLAFGATTVTPSCSSSTYCTAIVPTGSGTVALTLREPVLDYAATLPRPPAPLQTFTATTSFSFVAMPCSYAAGCGGSIDVQCTPDGSDDPMFVTAYPPGGAPQTFPLTSSGWGQVLEGNTTSFMACVKTPGGTSCNPLVSVSPSYVPCAPVNPPPTGGGGGGIGYHGPSGCVGRCQE